MLDTRKKLPLLFENLILEMGEKMKKEYLHPYRVPPYTNRGYVYMGKWSEGLCRLA